MFCFQRVKRLGFGGRGGLHFQYALTIKGRSNWRRRPATLAAFGLNSNAQRCRPLIGGCSCPACGWQSAAGTAAGTDSGAPRQPQPAGRSWLRQV